MRKIFIGMLLLFGTVTASAQANKKDVKTFLELSGNMMKYDVIVDQISEQISTDKREAFKKDMQLYINRIVTNDVDKYAAAFSQDEILKLIEFYKTPLGAKLVSKSFEISTMSEQEMINDQMELEGILMKYMMY